MATIVSSKLALLNKGRAKIAAAGLRPYRAWIGVDQWSGGPVTEVFLGELETTLVEILPPPEVLPDGNRGFKIDGITPAYNGGGWVPQSLLPAVEAGRRPFCQLQGPDGIAKPYKITNVVQTGAFSYQMTVQALDRTQPDLELADD